MKTRFALTAAAFALAAMPALAQDLPKTHLKITGGLSNLTAYQDYEVPFWTKTIPAQSKGQITAEIKGFIEMGIKGPELLRLMGSGVIEFGTATLAYFASDNPINEAIDLAGLAPDIKTAREVTQVFEPVYDKLYGQGNNVKLLGISTYPAQVLFCNADIKGLGDMKGKKVRTSSRTQADFVEALGGSSVTMAFGEVVPALQNKVVDCAITGSLSGHGLGLHQVTSHLHAMPLNWGLALFGANQGAWEALPAELRQLLASELPKLEEAIWTQSESDTRRGMACNTGQAACAQGRKGAMALVPVTPQDERRRQEIFTNTVLPRWLQRCGQRCADVWRQTLGPTLRANPP